jgi:RNA polymerase sigma-B factor
MTTDPGPLDKVDDDDVLRLFAELPEDERAREEIVRRFQPLAEYLSRRFAGRGEPLEDLIQVANIGLLGAIKRFDPEREVRFSTYAAATMIGELKRHFRDKGWTIRVPRRLQELGLRINRSLGAFSQELGRSPTIAEIAERLDVSEEEVVDAMEAAQAYSTVSLDTPINDEGTTSLDLLGDVDDSMEMLEGWASLAPAIHDLPARDRRVLYLRFFAGLTQSEIAEEIGVSQMHVSRILSQTLAILRDSVALEEPGDGPGDERDIGEGGQGSP